jgi:LPXTG-motif cell wall-anchored protein
MRRLGLFRLTAIATVAAVVGFASPAWADTTISVNSSGQNKTAATFPTQICKADQGGGPYAGQDVWVFILPGSHSTSGDFVSLTAHFSGQSDVTITAAANPLNFSNGGPDTAKAWITTPAGWTITGAEAVITGTADFFTLSHTCPAEGTSPSPSTSTSESASPSPSTSESHDPSTSVSASNPPLPRTGTAITSIVLSGLVAIAGGAVLLFVLRRRRDALMSSDE